MCTALTANFTLRHYNELGGAKGILESYLTLTLETCIDQHLARLILRQMCDFGRQAKAQPKTASELASAIAAPQDDSGAGERKVQLVLDHLVRSRLAVTVNGKVSLIHDYWVSVIRDITAHDRSEQEKADELLRRHLYELEAGFSSTLNSKQLSLVRRFANRELLSTEEATRLLRKSVLQLSVSRGVAVGVLLILFFVGMRSSHVVWEMTVLSDPGPGHVTNTTFLRDIDRLVVLPQTFGPQKRSSISVWNTKNGRRHSELTADAWEVSREGQLLLYSDAGRTYLTDLKRLITAPFPQSFTDGSVSFSRSAHCALYNSHRDGGKDSAKGPLGVSRLQLWSVPEGKLIGSTELQATGIESVFVSNSCDRVVFVSQEGASLSVTGNITSTAANGRPWIWNVNETKPKPLSAISRVMASVSEELKALITLETDGQGSGQIALWDLEKGVRRLERPVDLGIHDWGNIGFGPDQKYVVITSSTFSDSMAELPPRVRVVRTSDLQEPQLTKNRRLIQCEFQQTDPYLNLTGYFLWSIRGQGGYIWDASGNEALPLMGLDVSDIRACSVSLDRSKLLVLRMGGSAELWSFTGRKVADLLGGGSSKKAYWTLPGTAVELIRNDGEIILFDLAGRLLMQLTVPGSGGTRFAELPDVSFEPSCKHAFVWTPDGRFIKYRKALRLFDLPYSTPFFWQRANSSCEE